MITFVPCFQDSMELPLLIRMLTLGQAAWDIINKQVSKSPANNLNFLSNQVLFNQVFKEPKVDQEVITKLIPSLISLGVQDHINSLRGKLKVLDQKSEQSAAESVVEVKGADEKGAKSSKKKSKSKKV